MLHFFSTKTNQKNNEVTKNSLKIQQSNGTDLKESYLTRKQYSVKATAVQKVDRSKLNLQRSWVTGVVC